MDYKNMMNLSETIVLLLEFFKLDNGKASLWMITENPNLGNAVPFDLFTRGRGHKVLEFVKQELGRELSGMICGDVLNKEKLNGIFK
jgi:hypothetical protein